MNEHDATELAFKNGHKKGAMELIEHLENEGLLNMTPQGIAELKKKYGGMTNESEHT